MVLAAQHASEATITCGTVFTAVNPCLNYLRNKGPLTSPCCNAIRNLNKSASTTADRQAACRCLKQAAASISGLNPSIAAGLPGKC
ncbi:non-specific lipid-transfer protein, partial [Salmonella sp. s58953]|uniref:non-specific lipid-transfer protein n=1 Tax=Salmonella sp. s58953 TaxID=3159711 RepID=UPI00398145BA